MTTVGASIRAQSSTRASLSNANNLFSLKCNAKRHLKPLIGRQASTIRCGIQAKGNKQEAQIGKDIGGEPENLEAPSTDEDKQVAPEQGIQQEAAAAASSAATTTGTETTIQRTETLSEDEIRRLAGLRREELRQKEMGLVEGVVQEVGLIEWPKPGEALLNTALVLGIVAGVSLALFGVNSVLAELTKLVYGGS